MKPDVRSDSLVNPADIYSLAPAVGVPWSVHTCDAVAGCSAGRFSGGSGFPPE